MTDPTRRRTFVRTLAAGLGALTATPASADVALAGDTYVDPRKVLLWESTRKEFREAIEGGALKAVIVPTGSTEQHNEHLAMINDTASVTLVAQQAALLVYPQVTVATPVSIGISPHWMDRKGTLSLKKETFLAVVFEICESLRTHGVTRILVLNGHGGNVAPLRESVPEFARKLGIRIETNSYWDAYTPEIIKRYMQSGKAPGHAARIRNLVCDGGVSATRALGGRGLRADQAAVAHQGSCVRGAGRGVRTRGQAGYHGEGRGHDRHRRKVDGGTAAPAHTSVGTGTHMLREALNWSLSVNRRTTGRTHGGLLTTRRQVQKAAG